MVTATGGHTLILTSQGGTLDGVVLNTDLTIGPGQHLGFAGAWNNGAALVLNGGQLDLGGTFTRAALGNWRWTGGTVNLTGTLNNTGATLDLDQASGFFVLANGTITGGTVNARGAAHVVVSNSNGRLDGVTVNGTIDVGYGDLAVTNGLTLNGTVNLSENTTAASSLSFQGSQILSGTAMVVFGSSAAGVVQAVNGTVTLNPLVTVLGRSGHLINAVNQGLITLSDPQGNFSLEGTSWRNAGRIVLSAGTLKLGGTFTLGSLGDVRRTGGTVDLTGTLDDTGSTLALNAATGSWQLVGGTIRGGTATTQDGAALIPTGSESTLDGVTLNTDLTIPGNARLSFAGTWSNHGTLTLDHGMLTLGGTFTLTALGTLRRLGGTVTLSGTLNNTGTTLTLNDTTGSWVLHGGTINGGTVDLQGGAGLMVTARPNRMNGVTFNGNLTLVDADIFITNGLTLNGTLTLGANSYGGALLFQGTQTLGGNATIVFQGSSAANALAITTDGDTLTLGPGVTVHGGYGSLGYSPYWTSGTNLGLVIEGPVGADVRGETITLAAAMIDNQGSLGATNRGTLRLQRPGGMEGITNEGTVTIDADSSLVADDPYIQTGGATYLNGGTLTAPLVDLQGGMLGGSGVIVGDVQNAALMAVGSDGVPGSLAIQGDYTQTADGTLAMKIGGTDQGTGYDYLSVSGTATLDGTLEVSVLDGFFARRGDTFTLVSFDQLQGEFATVHGRHPEGQDVHFDPVYDDTSFTLVAVPYRGRRHGDQLDAADRGRRTPTVGATRLFEEIAIDLMQKR